MIDACPAPEEDPLRQYDWRVRTPSSPADRGLRDAEPVATLPATFASSLFVPRSLRGFTLIELLIVIVIIGVLAAIAIPKYNSVKARAYFTVMRSDLRNLATAQEAYQQMSGAFYGGPIPAPGTSIRPSTGVTITIVEASASGWAARATHASAPGKACAVFHGDAAAVAPATTAGEIACD